MLTKEKVNPRTQKRSKNPSTQDVFIPDADHRTIIPEGLQVQEVEGQTIKILAFIFQMKLCVKNEKCVRTEAEKLNGIVGPTGDTSSLLLSMHPSNPDFKRPTVNSETCRNSFTHHFQSRSVQLHGPCAAAGPGLCFSVKALIRSPDLLQYTAPSQQLTHKYTQTSCFTYLTLLSIELLILLSLI